MADVKISELTAATSISGSDTLPIVQSSTTKKATAELLKSYRTYVAKTAAYTATASDDVILCDASGGAFSVTLPAVASSAGKVFTIKNVGASGTVTIDGNASETIDGATTVAMATQYNFRTIICDGTEWHVIASS